ncbi:class C beta-lactamase-related serine hydrolase [Flexivirga caeni]|uniref:Class C beta-lactamase-related serine hydrolase n=2 Tax=Flexivirga caeni TaxID=2294115 RepID=A0A3M9MH91_9MICO|nr:class C beta-lactamase-related serine hydrolase [Flexivirga caeni]
MHPHSQVTLDNWQIAPQLHWSMQHIEDLFPTAAISRGTGPVAALDYRPDALGAVQVAHPDGTTSSVADVMAFSNTDAWIVTQGSRIIAEEYPSEMLPDTRHLLMSVSKSLVGTVAGALIASGELDPAQLVSTYVPDLADSGYAGATLRNLLDMRSGIHFSEEYLDPTAEVRVLEQAIGWATRTHPGVPRTMYDFLLTLRQKSPHGGPFEYRSGETDVLGWVCEAAAGTRMPQLMSTLLWSRLGTEEDAVIAIDSAGAGMFDGGICAILRDLARFGAMLVRDGISLTGEQVVPAWWIDDACTGDPDSRAAFAQSPTITLMPGGMYRNQFWLPYPDRNVLLCLGIHGQMIYADRDTGVVAVKLSSWPDPQDAVKLFSTLRAFETISRLYA